MPTAKFSFEGGSNGANVAAGAGAGTGDTNFDVITRGTSATLAYDNTHPGRGSLGLKIATGATSTTSNVSWTTTIGTQTTFFIRFLCYITGAPAANIRVYNNVGAASSRGNILLNTNGKFIFTNAAGSTVLTSATLPTNSTFRVEAKFVSDNAVGQWEYKIWYDPRDVGTPNDTQTSAATQVNGGTTDTYRFGIGTNIASGGPYWMDDVAVSTVGYIGPEDPRVTGTATVNAKKCSIAVQGFTGTVTISAKKSSLDVVDRSTVSGGPKLKKMRVSASLTETTTITAAPRTKKMQISGSLAGVTVISGGPRTKKMRVAASIVILDQSILTGHLSLKKMRVSASLTGVAVISGGVRLHKMRIQVFSAETAVISGGPRTKKMHVHVNAVRPVASEILVFTPV